MNRSQQRIAKLHDPAEGLLGQVFEDHHHGTVGASREHPVASVHVVPRPVGQLRQVSRADGFEEALDIGRRADEWVGLRIQAVRTSHGRDRVLPAPQLGVAESEPPEIEPLLLGFGLPFDGALVALGALGDTPVLQERSAQHAQADRGRVEHRGTVHGVNRLRDPADVDQVVAVLLVGLRVVRINPQREQIRRFRFVPFRPVPIYTSEGHVGRGVPGIQLEGPPRGPLGGLPAPWS